VYTNNMKTAVRTATPRSSAEERREEILEAAVTEFAIKGLHGTSTETIARRVGLSQPYLFRLFGTKKDLFLAAVQRAFDRVLSAFRLAVERSPETPFTAMALAYQDLLVHREEMLLQMQAYVACSDPEVQKLVRARFAELYRFVEQATGASADEVRDFFAIGMLLNVAAAMDLPAVVGKEDWVQRCLPPRP
jgi:AcrR family transcriptional regulator